MSQSSGRGRQEEKLWGLFEVASKIEFGLNQGHCPDRDSERHARIHLDEAYRLIKQGLLNKEISNRSAVKIANEIESQLKHAVEAIWPSD